MASVSAQSDVSQSAPVPDSGASADLVDRILGEWAVAYPDLDVSPIGVLGRVSRIASLAAARLDRNLEQFNLGRSEFDVLGALVRSSRSLRASEVVSTTMLSGASVTKISENLVRRGLIDRHKSERDGRVVLLAVTPAGRELVEQVLPRRLADDARLLVGLTSDDRDQLARLLRKMSVSLPD